MQLRTLGNSDLKITPLGVGAWAMGGGGWAFGWGPQDDAQSVAAIHAALVSNSSVEDFLAASPEKAEYTSTRGAQQSVTASGWYGYALKRGWIKVGSIEEAESESEAE